MVISVRLRVALLLCVVTGVVIARVWLGVDRTSVIGTLVVFILAFIFLVGTPIPLLMPLPEFPNLHKWDASFPIVQDGKLGGARFGLDRILTSPTGGRLGVTVEMNEAEAADLILWCYPHLEQDDLDPDDEDFLDLLQTSVTAWLKHYPGV